MGSEAYFSQERTTYFPLPPEVIDRENIIINSNLQGHFEDPNLEGQFLDKDWIINTFGIFSFGKENPPAIWHRKAREVARQEINPPSGGRSFTAFRFDEPVVIDCLPYSELNGKGTGSSSLLHGNSYLYPYRPNGFFDYNNAVRELNRSEEETALGNRTNRVLAIIPLKSQELRKWLVANKRLFHKRHDPIKELDKMIADNITPAIVIRFTHPRYEELRDNNRPAQDLYSKENIFQTLVAGHKAEMVARARVMHTDGVSAFMDYYQIHDTLYDQTFRNLLQTIMDNPLQDASMWKNLILLDSYLFGLYIGKYYARNANVAKLLLPFAMKTQDLSVGAFLNDYDSQEAYERNRESHLLFVLSTIAGLDESKIVAAYKAGVNQTNLPLNN